MKIENGAEYELEIESVSSDGNGVAHIDRLAVFVPFTAAGDIVKARIKKVQKSYAEAEVTELLSPSPLRTKPECPYYYECGGCELLHMNYEAQIEAKKGTIENAMRRIGGFADFSLDEMLKMDEPVRYRNKMIFHAGLDDGRIVFGFYAPKSHRVIPMGDCISGDRANGAVISAVTEYMEETGLTPYDERTGRGAVRMIFTRRAKISDELMVVIGVNGRGLPQSALLTEKLLKADKNVKSIILNVNNSRHSHNLGVKNITLYGTDHIEDEISGVRFRISPNSFFQVNPIMTKKLYEKAIGFAELDSSKTVLDIYCGIGTISLLAAKKAKSVIGVEIVEKAIEDAKKNAEMNGIDNALFYAKSAESIVPRLIEDGARPDTVILDPPRKGSDKATLAAILKAEPERIVYVSCNPATLARDARIIADGGYRIEKACGADMFPGSCHVETVVLMAREDK
jgi:23S rRNA (uracil1939-C5)-methyltransferase